MEKWSRYMIDKQIYTYGYRYRLDIQIDRLDIDMQDIV